MKAYKNLLQKYNVPVPRYTSYPPANYFYDLSDMRKTAEIIKQSDGLHPQNISFYLHIPFCSQLCYYCGCNTHITQNKSVIEEYVEALKKEILLYKELLSPGRKISQIHWGGGTPDYLDIEHIKSIMAVFYENFDFIDDVEIAAECHPAHLTFDYMKAFIDLKFNRISVGVQDFNKKVLKNVNRAFPNLSIEDIVSFFHDKGVKVNLDFVYGLPGQTVSSFSKTIGEAVNISPDRLVLFSYAHVPWVKPHQKLLEKYDLPDAELKTDLFETAFNILTENGYVSIGLDHFAKSDDELYKALKNKELSRNFQGYCTRKTTGQVYALGVSGISQLNNAYLQNTKDLSVYSEKINKGIIPVEKMYALNEKEKITGHIITEIMANRFLSLKEVGRKFNISDEEIKNITKLDLNELNVFKEEGIIEFENDEISVTQKGMFFLRNITRAFDPLRKNTEKKFSKSI